jgi:hypothetical protein
MGCDGVVWRLIDQDLIERRDRMDGRMSGMLAIMYDHGA